MLYPTGIIKKVSCPFYNNTHRYILLLEKEVVLYQAEKYSKSWTNFYIRKSTTTQKHNKKTNCNYIHYKHNNYTSSCYSLTVFVVGGYRKCQKRPFIKITNETLIRFYVYFLGKHSENVSFQQFVQLFFNTTRIVTIESSYAHTDSSSSYAGLMHMILK